MAGSKKRKVYSVALNSQPELVTLESLLLSLFPPVDQHRPAVSPATNQMASPRVAGRKRPSIRSFAAAGVLLYLVVFASSVTRSLRDDPTFEESEYQKKLADGFVAPNSVRIQKKTGNVRSRTNPGNIRGKLNSTDSGRGRTNRVSDSREKLRFKLDKGSKNDALSLWELSDFLPSWLKEYLEWHKEKRQTLTEELWHGKNNTSNNILDANISAAKGPKFLVVQCMPNKRTGAFDKSSSGFSCGNLMERLGLLPYFLKLAHQTNRVLFLHWTVPTDLSEYLEPPMGGCDWRAPMWLQQLLLDDQQGILINNATQIVSNTSYLQGFDSESLWRVQLKHSAEFEDAYNGDESIVSEESSYQEVFSDLWNIFFVPSEVIRKGISNAFLANRGMKAGQYTSIDLSLITSAKEQERNTSEDISISKANQVVNYVSKLLPNEPFMLISDDTNVTRHLIDHNVASTDNKTNEKVEHVVTLFARYKIQSNWARKHGINDTKEILPQELIDLDAADFPIHKPETFNDVFTNLYLMTMGRCILSYKPGHFEQLDGALNPSTFSHLASLIGYDSKCYREMDIEGQVNIIDETSFLDHVNKPEILGKRDAPKINKYFCSPIVKDGADEMTHISQQIKQAKEQYGGNSTDLLQEEKMFPLWMKEYIAWHRATRSQLARSNWNDSKYLIAGCFEDYKHCGGISDRLRPLPMLIWEAHQSQRLLLIWWEKPKPLEEWLVPPQHIDGGVDWTVPSFLKEEILKAQPNIRDWNGMNTLNNWGKRDNFRDGFVRQRVVVYSIQSPDAGEDHYTEEQILLAKQTNAISRSVPGNNTLTSFDSHVTGSTYQDVFHHIFRRFFTPSPRLASLLDSKMKEHNLMRGEYTAVHLRALYGERSHRDPQEALELAVLGANCASNLYPGTPVYFASDMSFAVDAAHAYGNLHQLPIVSLDTDPEFVNNSSNPIHLDKDPDWKIRPASAYDSTFVDLYLLAESRCVAYSNGGYGLFGSLLSHESECRMRFFKGRKKTKRCAWMNDKFERQELELPKLASITAGGRVGKDFVDIQQ